MRAGEPTSDLCLQLKVMLAMSQVAPEELQALLKNVISEASTDLDVGTDGFTTAKWKRGSRHSKNASKRSKSSKSSNSSYVESKKRSAWTAQSSRTKEDQAPRPSTLPSVQMHPNMHAYIKGIDFDIHHQVMKHVITFKRSLCSSFGDVAAVKLLRSCLRVTCRSDPQRQQLLTAISISPPSSILSYRHCVCFL